MTAGAWIGPAIVAAVISALVTGLGWYVSESQASRRESTRRRERIGDVQTALLAEIRAGRHRLGDLHEHAAHMDGALSRDAGFSPFVPRQAPTFVMDALVQDIHVLPISVIDSIVLYYRQAKAIAYLIEDIRSEAFCRLPSDRKRLIYRDYVQLLLYSDILAREAEDAICRSLNIPVGDRSDPQSA